MIHRSHQWAPPQASMVARHLGCDARKSGRKPNRNWKMLPGVKNNKQPFHRKTSLIPRKLRLCATKRLREMKQSGNRSPRHSKNNTRSECPTHRPAPRDGPSAVESIGRRTQFGWGNLGNPMTSKFSGVFSCGALGACRLLQNGDGCFDLRPSLG